MTRALPLAILAATVAGCTGAPSPGPVTTVQPTPTPRHACTVESRPLTGTVTRFAAAPGTAWWVTYTVIVNPCDQPAKLTGLRLGGQQPGSGAVWSGDSKVQVLKEGEIPDAILPGGTSSGLPVADYTIRPSERVEVVALVRAGGGTDMSHRVPALRLGLTDGGGADDLLLAPDVRLCACNPLG